VIYSHIACWQLRHTVILMLHQAPAGLLLSNTEDFPRPRDILNSTSKKAALPDDVWKYIHSMVDVEDLQSYESTCSMFSKCGKDRPINLVKVPQHIIPYTNVNVTCEDITDNDLVYLSNCHTIRLIGCDKIQTVRGL
jgi:hypothetical protein